MSQFFVGPSSGSLPPDVATSYVTDDGTAIPSAHILNVNGLDSIENNSNGIITRANPNNSNNLEVILTNRVQVTATTSDGAGQTQSVTVLTPADATAIVFSGSFIGYDAVNNEAVGGLEEGVARKSGGTVVIVGINDSLDVSDPGLIDTDWNVIVSGASIEVEFIGVAGKTINWTCLFTYTLTS